MLSGYFNCMSSFCSVHLYLTVDRDTSLQCEHLGSIHVCNSNKHALQVYHVNHLRHLHVIQMSEHS